MRKHCAVSASNYTGSPVILSSKGVHIGTSRMFSWKLNLVNALIMYIYTLYYYLNWTWSSKKWFVEYILLMQGKGSKKCSAKTRYGFEVFLWLFCALLSHQNIKQNISYHISNISIIRQILNSNGWCPWNSTYSNPFIMKWYIYILLI